MLLSCIRVIILWVILVACIICILSVSNKDLSVPIIIGKHTIPISTCKPYNRDSMRIIFRLIFINCFYESFCSIFQR